ncbi:hypothetical protein FACS189472_06710 [Alphaproteobacteria bacterium]|nr:hypothetical protein FACS189472_06710 [Alphaproteobacteria bacterium]
MITGISIVKSIKSESHSFRNGALINIFLFAIAIAAYFVAKPQISDVLQDPDAQTLIYVFGGVFIAAAIVLLAAAYPNWSHHRRFLINAIILAAAVAAYFLVELNSMLYDFIYVLGVIFIVTAIVLLVATYPKWSRYWRLLNNVILAFTAWFVVVLLIFASDVLQGLNGLAIGVFFALVLVPIAFVLLTIALVFGHLLDNACAAHADSIGYRYNALLLFLFLGANMMWVINKASTYYQDVKKPSTKNMADIIRLNKNKDDLVFCYDRYYQDFPVYLNSTVNIVNFVGELEFGANAEKEKHVIWQDKEFWDFWKTTDKRIFLLISKEKYREVFASKVGMHNILDFDKNFTVISNQRNQRDVGSNNASPTSETYASTIFNAEAASASQRGVGSDNDKTCAASTNMSNK